MIYSPWGNYVSGSASNPPGPALGASQYSSGATPGTSPSAAAYFSPDAIAAYGNVTSTLMSAIFNRGAPPPVTEAPSTSPVPTLLIVGGVAVGAILLIRALRKK